VDYAATGKQFVFIVSLLGIFFTLVMTMPNGFYVVAPQYEETDFPDYRSAEEVKTLISHGEENITEIFDWYYITISRGGFGDVHVRIMWFNDEVNFQHWNWGFFGWGIGWLEPYPLTEDYIIDKTEESGNLTRIEMTCDHHNYVTYFSFNGSAYSNLLESIEAGELCIQIWMDWDYEESMLSGWDLVARLLTFQLPYVTPEISFLIGIPLIALIGFLTFTIIMMVINALPFT